MVELVIKAEGGLAGIPAETLNLVVLEGLRQLGLTNVEVIIARRVVAVLLQSCPRLPRRRPAGTSLTWALSGLCSFWRFPFFLVSSFEVALGG